jgi:hypothetical protein
MRLFSIHLSKAQNGNGSGTYPKQALCLVLRDIDYTKNAKRQSVIEG